jgi:hypothetical protein
MHGGEAVFTDEIFLFWMEGVGQAHDDESPFVPHHFCPLPAKDAGARDIVPALERLLYVKDLLHTLFPPR